MLCRYAPAQQHRLDPYPLLRTPVDSGGYAGWITPARCYNRGTPRRDQPSSMMGSPTREDNPPESYLIGREGGREKKTDEASLAQT